MDIKVDVSAKVGLDVLGILKFLNEKVINKKEKAKEEKIKALSILFNAIRKTKEYLYDWEKHGTYSREQERELSRIWEEVSNAIYAYDETLFRISEVKSLAYANEGEWEKLQSTVPTVKLDDILKQYKYHMQTLES